MYEFQWTINDKDLFNLGTYHTSSLAEQMLIEQLEVPSYWLHIVKEMV